MSTGTLAILIVLGFALSIALGKILKVHVGVLALCFAMIIGAVSGQLKLSGVIALWPLTTFVLVLAITLFYGYAIENGTLDFISTSMVYAFRNIGWMIPIVIWLIGFVLSATGSGALGSAAVLAPLAASIAADAGIPYFPVLVAVYTSTIAGGNSPIAQQGGTMIGYVADWGDYLADKGMEVVLYSWKAETLVCLVFFFIFYFAFKCYKTKALSSMEKPAPATKNQKTMIFLIALSIILLIVPASIANITKNATWKTISSWCDVKSICFLLAAVCAILKVADEKAVLTKRVPWSILLMMAGVGTLVGIASKVGVVDMMATWISESVPTTLIAPAFALAGGILSTFSGALSVVCPLFFPMVPALATQTGLNPALLYTSIYAGAASTGVSPLSTGGAMILANVVSASEAKKKSTGEDAVGMQSEEKMFQNQFLVAIGFCILVIIFSWLKIYDIFGYVG